MKKTRNNEEATHISRSASPGLKLSITPPLPKYPFNSSLMLFSLFHGVQLIIYYFVSYSYYSTHTHSSTQHSCQLLHHIRLNSPQLWACFRYPSSLIITLVCNVSANILFVIDNSIIGNIPSLFTCMNTKTCVCHISTSCALRIYHTWFLFNNLHFCIFITLSNHQLYNSTYFESKALCHADTKAIKQEMFIKTNQQI